jgi:hypothetical protein
MKSSSPSILSLLPMAIGEGTFSLVVGGLPISVFSGLLPSVLTAAGGRGGEILDAGRIEALTHTRRQLDAARLEHAGLVGDLEDARPLSSGS